MVHPEPISVFLSYARKDESLLQKLEAHLSGLWRQGLISTWQKHLVLPGAERTREIEKQLNSARIILLLISADFLASDYCYSTEMTHALERHRSDKARVIPIIARPCDWSHSPFAQLECLPRDRKPITTWSDRDLAFLNIAIQIRRVVEELQILQTSIVSPLHEELAQNNLQTPLENKVNEQIDNNTQQENIEKRISQTVSKFRHYQEKASELKSIHNMLHEIEAQLEGLSVTIQLLMRGEGGEIEINQHSSDFGYIEIVWRKVTSKIDDLAYFATEVLKTLEDERLILDSNTIRGASWIKDLLIIQRSLEAGIREQNVGIVRKSCNELLVKCRTHLYRIDQRLLEAVKDLELSPHSITRGVI